MRMCCVWLLLMCVVVEGSLGGLLGQPNPIGGGGKRPVSDPILRGSTSPQVMEPLSLRSLDQQLVSMQRKIDLIASDVSSSKQKLDTVARNVDQLMRYLLKSSCSEVGVVDPLLTPGGVTGMGPGAAGGVSRQNSVDGVYAIFPPNGHPKRVKCDHSSNGDPGWTVVLLRADGSVEFNRTMEEYKTGFGDPNGEVWIGLDTLYQLTSSRPQQLRVELKNFAGQTAYAHYREFSIGDALHHYKLSVGGYDPRSTAGDPLKDHNNMLFSTIDVDHDKDGGSCARQFGGDGGWWYAKCYHALGTGRYRRPSTQGRGGQVPPAWGGVTWHPFSDVKQSLQYFKMLIKPRDL